MERGVVMRQVRPRHVRGTSVCTVPVKQETLQRPCDPSIVRYYLPCGQRHVKRRSFLLPLLLLLPSSSSGCPLVLVLCSERTGELHFGGAPLPHRGVQVSAQVARTSTSGSQAVRTCGARRVRQTSNKPGCVWMAISGVGLLENNK